MKKEVTVDTASLTELKGCQAAWYAVFNALCEGNPGCFHGYGTGMEKAVEEIKRLQAIERKTKESK